MKAVKTLIAFILTGAIVAYAGYSLYNYSLSPCDKVLEYGIGRFDNKFGLSKQEFKTYILEAESVWEKALGKNVFAYNEEADFKVNLIYDERQLATVQKQKTEFGLSSAESVFEKLDADFNNLKRKHDAEENSYEEDLAAFELRKEKFERNVNYYNDRGGAKEPEYQALQKESAYLNNEVQVLNSRASNLNESAKELNTLLQERNRAAAEYNKIAQSYNKKYGHGLEFDQAEYVGEEINIYQFGNKKDLTLAITHELGHALGMDHVENPHSIMYYVTGGNTEVSLNPSTEDLAELRKVCKMAGP